MRPQMTVLDVLYNLLGFWCLVLCLAGGGCRSASDHETASDRGFTGVVGIDPRNPGVGRVGLSYSR